MKPPIPAAYDGAIESPCPTCGAEPGEFCLAADGLILGTRRRRIPCVRRRPPSKTYVAYQDAPARSFSEPIHPHGDDL